MLGSADSILDRAQFIQRDKNKDPFADTAAPNADVNPDAFDTDAAGAEESGVPSAKKRETGPDLDTLYTQWSKKPDPHTMGQMLHRLKPTISAAMTTYAGGNNPILMGRAKKIALDAVKSYKPSADATLKSWVSLNLKGLQRYASSMSPIQVPERVRMDQYKLHKASTEFSSVHGRDPNDDELADLTGMSMKRINYVRKLAVPVVNEGMFTVNEGEEGQGGIIPGVASNEWQNIWAEYVYNDLDPINKQIFDMRAGRGAYQGKPVSVGEIAKKLKMTPAAVSLRSNKIADKLAEAFEMKDKI